MDNPYRNQRIQKISKSHIKKQTTIFKIGKRLRLVLSFKIIQERVIKPSVFVQPYKDKPNDKRK